MSTSQARYNWPSRPDASSAHHVYFRFERDYGCPISPIQEKSNNPIRGTAAIPRVIKENWFRFAKSDLPESAWDDLVSGASAAEASPDYRASLSSTALQVFLELWSSVREQSAGPILSVTPKGAVVAEWVQSDEMSLAIMTNDSGIIYYSLFNNENVLEGHKNRDEINDLVQIITSAAEAPFSWSDPGE